jgi:flagellar biosynthesis/type III secretory pathway protein FliH
MLFKHDSVIARNAALADSGRTASAAQHSASVHATAADRKPDPRDARIAELDAANGQLREELQQLRETWNAALAKAIDQARTEAARAHVRQDEAMARQLETSCAQARQAFDTMLDRAFAGNVGALAAQALERLVAPNETELAWLGRSVSRRLERVRAEAVVAIEVNPALFDSDRSSAFASALPTGTDIKPNAAVAAGTARIVLKLGAITIEPAQGRERLLAALRALDHPDDD